MKSTGNCFITTLSPSCHQLFHLSQRRTPPFRTKATAFLTNPPLLPIHPLPRNPHLCMGKRLPAAAIAAALRPCPRNLRSSPAAGKAANPPPAPLDTPRNAAGAGAGTSSGRAEVRDLKAPFRTYEDERMPLSEVVSDCTKRWFQDALKEARAGDAAMQVLVGQMYRSGYGVNKNEHKARIWMEKASRYRSTVWKVSNKRPGYNASDSDSDDAKETSK